MTAKEQLLQVVEKLSEAEAADALDLLVGRREPDALDEFLAQAPIDDEPITAEEEEGVREARAEIARGEVFTAEQIKREIA